MTDDLRAEQNRGVVGRRRTDAAAAVAVKEHAMTLSQARKRYPLVPRDIVKWAVENIQDPEALARGLYRLEQARRIQVKYGV